MSERDEIVAIPRSPKSAGPSNKSRSTKNSDATKKKPVKKKSNTNVEKTSDAGVRKESKKKPARKPSAFDLSIAAARHDMEETRKVLESAGKTLSMAANYTVEDDEEAVNNQNEQNDGDNDFDEIQPNVN